jgi:hypothetical protein
MVRKYAPGYDFRSSESLSQRDRERDQRSHRASPPSRTPPAQEPAPDTPVALARLNPPLRSEPGEDGKHSCARGDWCTASQSVTANGETRRVPERCYQPFCHRDRRCLETDLQQLPAQFVHLAAEIGNPVRNGQVIHVPFGPRCPIRLDVDALMRAIEESLSSWHERVADVDSLSYPLTADSRLQRQMVAVRNAERVLIHRIEPLLALGPQVMERTRRVTSDRDPKGRGTEDVRENEPLDGADAGMEIFTLRWLCRAVLGETKARPEELLGVPCRREECDTLALRRAELPSDPGAPVWWSECSECGDKLAEEEYRDWTARYARWAQAQQKTPATLENLPGVA